MLGKSPARVCGKYGWTLASFTLRSLLPVTLMAWLRALLFASLASLATAATFTWTGAGNDSRYDNPANWAGGVVPANDGSAVLDFGASGAGAVQLPAFAILRVARIHFSTTTPYSLNGLALIHVDEGITADAASARFASGISLSLGGGSQTIDVQQGELEIAGTVLGVARLEKTGSGRLVLSGLALYTGGTRVEAGSILFTSAAAIPPAGSISSASNAYVGVSFTQSLQSELINRLDRTGFLGTIGLDTDVDASTPAIFAENIDLTRLSASARLGTETAARITGSILIASGSAYRFGGGDGTLYIESDLSAANSRVSIRSLHGTPLGVVLRGNNSFRGQVDILNSILVLDSASALPGIAPNLTTRRIQFEGAGYAGYTENYGVNFSNFLSRFGTITQSQAIVGIDSANTAQPRTVGDAIDLSAGGTRTDPFYLGTSSRVTITGTITPTVGDDLYLTAVKDGHLTVASTLGTNIPGLVVGQADSFDPRGGVVELTGANTYSGGTRVLGGTLIAGHNSALGLGGVVVGDRSTLQIAPSVLISNPLTLSSGSTLSGFGGIASPGGVTIGSGARLSPGGNDRVGTLSFHSGLTFAEGGRIAFNLLDPAGSAGAGWDAIRIIGGSLALTATSTSPFMIDLISLTANGTTGPVSIFDATQHYSWTFVIADNISGFSADQFAFNTAGFLPSLQGGEFFVTQNQNGLAITFTPVPEPSTYLLMALGIGVVAIFEIRRRRK